eukprot:c12030_g1_i1.p1 GENE.c12030_g1_i1~~c12030_g1_i1.p1  ORF type:complete len:271 (+),score=52.10 c12030_g1_i1:773-1585(+)
MFDWKPKAQNIKRHWGFLLASHSLVYLDFEMEEEDLLHPDGAVGPLPQFLHRVINMQMDFEYAFWQMINLCLSPSKVTRVSHLRKQSRHRMARDDPAFVVTQLIFLVVSSMSYTVAYHSLHPAKIAEIMFYTVLVDWLLVGVIVSTVCWIVTNYYLATSRANDPRLEWRFAFDTHCNSFFPLFILLYVIQYFLAPFLLQPLFVSRLAANTLYLLAFVAYSYITFISYSDVDFLHHTEVFLYPIGVVVLGYILSLLLGINLTRMFLTYYYT